jgi:hypothetical protein
MLEPLEFSQSVLLPKKDGAQNIGDYRPISIIHSVAKLMGKILANRLQLYMERLISPA